ncbi:hypothetical protein ACFQZE_12460 [Paenibacillus sp. GCM10027627]|uniref:hypothetical protein n=1 Tax=unclassified Paenibacillus TaxID=185978 RepID=UPI00363F592E
MKKSVSLIVIMLAVVLSFTTTAFAAFSYNSGNITLSGGTIKLGQGVISNSGTTYDTLTVKLYRGTTLVSIKTITYAPGQWTYPGYAGAPEIILATGQPAGQYRYELSASGNWHVLAGIHN